MRSTNRKDNVWMHVLLLGMIACAFALACPLGAVAEETLVAPAINIEEYPLIVDQRDVGPYCLRIRGAVTRPKIPNYEYYDSVLEIRKGPQGILVHLSREETASFPEECVLIADNVQYVVVETFSGGMSCCFDYIVFELGETVKIIARPGGGKYRQFGSILRLRGEDLLIDIPDSTFLYWHPEFPSSTFSDVTAVIKHDGLHLDTQSFWPGKVDLDFWAESILSVWDDKSPTSRAELYMNSTKMPTPVVLFEYMQVLCYKGHGELAWKLLNRVWPANEPGKDEYLALFRKELRTSPFWRDICALNKWEPDAWKEAEK